jgi:hypothetical protein
MKYTTFIFIAVALMLSGCGTANLYPVNDKAKKIGLVKLNYSQGLTGLGGGVTGTMPNGEALTGEYTSIDIASHTFGNIYSSVITNGTANSTVMGNGFIANGTTNYSSVGSASGTAHFTSSSGSRPGMVSLVGNQGTSIECEYLFNSFGGGGLGACKTQDGALFRMHIR